MNNHVTILLICLTIAAVSILLLAIIVGHRRRWRDSNRLFSREQKQILLARAGYRCEHKHPLWRRCRSTSCLQADHIMPWSRGGATEVWNGQVLCKKHNQRKSNGIPSGVYRWRLQRRRRRYAPAIEVQTPRPQRPDDIAA